MNDFEYMKKCDLIYNDIDYAMKLVEKFLNRKDVMGARVSALYQELVRRSDSSVELDFQYHVNPKLVKKAVKQVFSVNTRKWEVEGPDGPVWDEIYIDGSTDQY